MDTIRIGYFHTRKNPDKIRKLYAFNAVAKAEGIEFFYFTPRRVNLSARTIRGLVYENGGWVKKSFPFPDAIYNDGYPKYQWGAEIIDELYKSIPHTSHSIGDKMTVYRMLQLGKQFSEFLIPSYPIQSVNTVLRRLEQYSDVVLKPTSGHQGIGVLRIQKLDDKYLVTGRDSEQWLNIVQLKQFIKERTGENDHIVQPFIFCQTKSGNTYDFRLHVQKNGFGEWGVTSIYPRIAKGNGVIPNLSGGGYTTMPKYFFVHEFGQDAEQVHDTLGQFALKLALHMDDIYEESFDELGIDVGLDRDRRIWIFELNWRPGPPPIWNVELDVARNSLLYAVYLAKHKS